MKTDTLIRYEGMKALREKLGLVEEAAKFVYALHLMYPGIKIKPIGRFEDEDFTFEIAVPRDLSIDEVLEACHRECIKVEDDYDLYILPHVTYAQ